MRYCKLGKTGFDVSELVLGTWAIGGSADWSRVSAENSRRAIDRMIEQGVNFIDTAPTYGNGEAERRLGEALRGRRRRIVLQTKFGSYWEDGKDGKQGGYVRDNSRSTILRMCDASLENLKTDYIDIYMIHWPDGKTPLEEIADTLKDLKKAGKIRFAGCSNFSLEQLQEIAGYGVIDVVQYGYSIVDQASEAQLRWASENGIATESYGTLGGGILTGKYRTYQIFDSLASRGRFYKFFQHPYFERVMKLLDVMDKIADDKKVPLSHISINWNLQKPFMDTVICGVSNETQAKENCDAMNITLTPEEMKRLDEAILTIYLQEEQED